MIEVIPYVHFGDCKSLDLLLAYIITYRAI